MLAAAAAWGADNDLAPPANPLRDRVVGRRVTGMERDDNFRWLGGLIIKDGVGFKVQPVPA